MKKNIRRWSVLLLVAAFTLAFTALGARGDDDDDDEDEIELDEAAVFIEWNSTDTDFGIHFFWDGEPWKTMTVKNHKGKKVLSVKIKDNLKKQGLTEAAFESAEPPASELSMEQFFERFPEGTYEFEGKTLEGEEIEGEFDFEHTLAAPPENLSPSTGDTVSHNGFTASFDEVTKDTDGNDADVAFYCIVIEKEDDDPILQKFELILRPGVTTLDVPGQFLEPDTEYKFEVVVELENGNRTITETGLFETDS